MKSTFKRTFVLATAAIVLAACGSQEPEQAETEELASEQSVEPRREVRRESTTADPQPLSSVNIPHIEPGLDEDEEGMGLTMIVDGTSPEAFAESLRLIAANASPEQYRRLDQSLRYLRLYDPAAQRGGLEALYRSLDGMSGEDIIQHALDTRDGISQRTVGRRTTAPDGEVSGEVNISEEDLRALREMTSQLPRPERNDD